MDWTPLQIEKALLRLEDALPRLMAEHDDPRAFSAAVRRESAQVEVNAGDFAPYVSRRIDAMLVALVRTGASGTGASRLGHRHAQADPGGHYAGAGGEQHRA